MSSSRSGGFSDTCSARSIRSSVVSPIAETTTTTLWPAFAYREMRFATRLMESASATEDPPNFWTTRLMGRVPSRLRAGGQCGRACRVAAVVELPGRALDGADIAGVPTSLRAAGRCSRSPGTDRLRAPSGRAPAGVSLRKRLVRTPVTSAFETRPLVTGIRRRDQHNILPGAAGPGGRVRRVVRADRAGRRGGARRVGMAGRARRAGRASWVPRRELPGLFPGRSRATPGPIPGPLPGRFRASPGPLPGPAPGCSLQLCALDR